MLACQRFENNNTLQIIIKNSFENFFFSVLEKSIKSEEKMRLQYNLSFTILVFILLTKNYQSWFFK